MLALRVLRALRGQDPFLFTTECTEVTEEMGLRPRLASRNRRTRRASRLITAIASGCRWPDMAALRSAIEFDCPEF
jgi:hypothetical protein